MSETQNLNLPLLAGNQAQKHVTVNEALERLDALVATSVISADRASPPESAQSGDCYLVAPGAGDEWSGRDGQLAFFVNAGWAFSSPRPGTTVWVQDRACSHLFDGDGWRGSVCGPSLLGAHMSAGLIVEDVAVVAGAGFETGVVIPDRAMVIGVTARVTEEISGQGVTGWRIGIAGYPDRYGASIGLPQNSVSNGVTGGPVSYYAPAPLRIEAEGGAFVAGSIRVAIHFLMLTPPGLVT